MRLSRAAFSPPRVRARPRLAPSFSRGPQLAERPSLVPSDRYHHVSSVSVGSTGNYIVASRELSTIWSLAHDGSGVQWTLSSQLESDFMFANPRDAFYQPHDVIELPNGNLLVIDDGTNRPGCYDRVTAECFSRAVMYALDSNADGVVVPQVRCADDVRSIVADCRYPTGGQRPPPHDAAQPEGPGRQRRGFGPTTPMRSPRSHDHTNVRLAELSNQESIGC